MKRVLIILLTFIAIASQAQSPKYIFYFIGDGMGANHIALARAAASAKDGNIGYKDLSFTNFPVVGYATTNAGTRLTTCSAAAGTALASGHKTSISTIGMDSDHKHNLPSVAVKAKENGKMVGIVTSVSIDHATPAAFFAHAPSRSMYRLIAGWIPKAGFDLYAGSGLLKVEESFYDSLQNVFGYSVLRGCDAELKGEKVVWVEKEGKNKDAFSMAIDRKEGDMALAEVVEKSINFLDNKKGFFMMVEGGQIDWCAHANDAAGIMYEVWDFSDAIDMALEFYKKHPKETLIVITADHETGGLALGRDDRGYDTNLEVLYTQGGSKGVVGKDKCNEINKAAGVGFTTGSHTAAFVPIYAIGAGSEVFNGEMDNTDIPNAIFKLLK